MTIIHVHQVSKFCVEPSRRMELKAGPEGGPLVYWSQKVRIRTEDGTTELVLFYDHEPAASVPEGYSVEPLAAVTV